MRCSDPNYTIRTLHEIRSAGIKCVAARRVVQCAGVELITKDFQTREIFWSPSLSARYLFDTIYTHYGAHSIRALKRSACKCSLQCKSLPEMSISQAVSWLKQVFFQKILINKILGESKQRCDQISCKYFKRL